MTFLSGGEDAVFNLDVFCIVSIRTTKKSRQNLRSESAANPGYACVQNTNTLNM